MRAFLTFIVLLLLHPSVVVLSVAGSKESNSCTGESEGTCKESGTNDPPIFDAIAKWIDERSIEGQKFLEQLLNDVNSKNSGIGDETTGSTSFFDELKDAFFSTQKEADGTSSPNPFVDMMDLFQTLFTPDADNRNAREVAQDFIQKAADLSQYIQSNKSTPNPLEFSKILMDAFGQVAEAIHRNFAHIDWHKLRPFDFMYFLEYVESTRTPSWKRRLHGFAPNVSANEVKELHKALYLSNLAYVDTAEKIKDGLIKLKDSDWELIHAQLTNAPGEPAHYIALKKNRKNSSRTYLDVLLVIRGTKDFKDVLSDGLLDAVDFRGGKAHAGLANSGKFIVKHHRDLLHQLMDMANKTSIKLTLIGHR